MEIQTANLGSGPARNYNQAAGQAMQRVLCFSVPFFAGLALRFPQTAPFAVPFLIYGALECDLFGGSDGIPQVPFVGGQCPTLYVMTVRGGINQDPVIYSSDDLFGPIENIVFNITGGNSSNDFWQPTVTRRDGNVHVETNGAIISPKGSDPGITYQLARRDGAADDCGSVPPTIPVPPPDPGDPPYPPIVFPPEGGPVYVEFQDGDDNIINVPITIGEINIPVDLDVPIEVTIDARRFVLSPDLTFASSDDDGAFKDEDRDKLDAISDEVPNLKGLIQDIQNRVIRTEQELYREVLTLVTRGECGEEDPETVEVTGNGFAFLASVLTQESSARYAQTDSLCDAEEPDLPDVESSVIASGVAGKNHSQFIQIPDETKVVALVCAGTPPGLRIYRNAGPQLEARFGFIAQAIDMGDAPCPKESQFVYTREHLLTMDPLGEKARFVRIALAEGLSWSLVDTGVR